MDWITLLSALGISGILTGLLNWLTGRQMNKELARNSNADYADKIIQQSNERVEQYKADAEMWRSDALAKGEEAKGQRKAKQEWRAKYEDMTSQHHTLELRNKDLESKLKEADWHRCEVNGCQNRIPPRTRAVKE